jgi:hypothetical protein
LIRPRFNLADMFNIPRIRKLRSTAAASWTFRDVWESN